jgi:dTDP-4-amino-4,6-dideoxy-D-galactose acyltransferase
MEDYYLLKWDSRFFGYKIACIKPFELGLMKLNKIIRELREKDFRLAYCFAIPEDKTSNDSLNHVFGLLVDEKITYFTKISEERSFPSSYNIMPYGLKYASEKLKSLTLQSGAYSRFKTDPNFPNNEFEKLYLEWIEKSVSGILSAEILVYNEDEEIKGFVTLALHNNTGSIGLIAVDEKQRGKSIGKELLNAALIYFKEKKITNAEIVTQKANIVACRFYESCGFKVKNIVNVYHLWIK